MSIFIRIDLKNNIIFQVTSIVS